MKIFFSCFSCISWSIFIAGEKCAALYLVFVPNTVNLPGIREQEETVSGILIRTYIVLYDEEKDFYINEPTGLVFAVVVFFSSVISLDISRILGYF